MESNMAEPRLEALEPISGVTIIRPAELGMTDVEELQDRLGELDKGTPVQLLINLEEARFVELSAVVQLIQIRREILKHGGQVAVVRPTDMRVVHILSMSGALAVFEPFVSEAEALRSLQQQ